MRWLNESDEAQVQENFVVRNCVVLMELDEGAQVKHDGRFDEAKSYPEDCDDEEIDPIRTV